MRGVSKELKSAMSEIDEIIKKYDINGAIFLADGKGNGEFKIHFETPTWSMARFLKTKKSGNEYWHLKSYMKSKPVETNRTISSIFNIEGMLMHVCHIVMTLCKDLDKRLNLDHDKNPMIIDSKDWDDE